MPETNRNGLQAAPNSHANQQEHSPRSHQQQHTAPTHKGNGDEIPLAALLRGPTPIMILLAPRPHQQSGLLDQASLHIP
jgi:hypothetical protein